MDELTPKFISYQLYLLQLENYQLGRYFRLLWSRGFFPSKHRPQRKELVWSVKAKAVLAMAVALHGLIVILVGQSYLWQGFGFDNAITAMVLVGLILLPCYFLLFSFSLLIIMPLDVLAKNRLTRLAKKKLAGMESLKIIAIAGSYGKTTMKEVLGQVLGIRYKVLRTPDSINTPVGVARWILNKVDDSTEIAIVEMGEHYRGDIEELCGIAKPDIAVVTGINESHFERMKSLDNIIATVFEVVSGAKAGAVIVLNGDDKNVTENYKKFVWPDHKVIEYKVESIKYKEFNTETLAWEFEINEIGKLELKLLGEYALGDVDAAIKIGKLLGMSNEQLRQGFENIKPIQHRLQPILSSQNVLIIDDAYNGNPDGAAEAIKVLSRFTNRRKLYITPGLVETGKAAPEVHRQIGRQLAQAADVVILIRNSVTPFIAEGMKSANQRISESASQIIWFDTAQEAHSELKNILKPNDVIVFQNDWGDQYL